LFGGKKRGNCRGRLFPEKAVRRGGRNNLKYGGGAEREFTIIRIKGIRGT